MTTRRWLAVIVGTLGIYFLVHAGFLGFGAYVTRLPQDQPLGASDPLKLQDTLQTWSAIFAALGVLCTVASVGIFRSSKWGAPLWLATSVTLLLVILYGMVVLNLDWTQYFYELAVILASWWFMWTIKRERRRET